MPVIPLRTSALYMVFCLPFQSQGQMKKISEPPGDTLAKAMRASTLGQAKAKPFRVRVEIAQTKGPKGEYSASIEETWVSATQWVRTVSAPGLMQKTVMDGSGPHIVSEGDYFPMWLRDFVTAVFAPVPDPLRWGLAKAPIEHVEFPNGQRSSPCQHSEFMLGVAPAEQVNFANDCFRAADGLLELAQSPDYTMEFQDYAGFGKLRVARTLVNHPSHGIEITGKVTTLEEVGSADPHIFRVPEDATAVDPLAALTLPSATMLQISGGVPALPWPSSTPGKGMFTAWVSVDRSGRVREAHTLNSDESGFAAEMTAKLVNMQWKPAVRKGVPVQAEGAIVFAYPPMQSGVVAQK